MQDYRVLSFLIGLGAGVGISMLLAPMKGRDARELIVDKFNLGRTSVERVAERMGNSASDWVEKGSALVNAVEAAKSTLVTK